MHCKNRIIPFYLFVFGILLISSGCGSTTVSRRHTLARQKVIAPQGVLCTVYVEGVECELCAQSVIDIVAKLPGVSNVRYHTTDATYAESFVTFLFDPLCGVISREQLRADLDKEGFSLISLSPNFL